MTKFRVTALLLSLSILILSSCLDNKNKITDPIIQLPELPELLLSDTLIVNPSGYAPLTAVVELELDIPVRVELYMQGKNGPASDVSHRFEETGTQLRLPIFGFYPDDMNTFELTFYTMSGTEIGSKDYTVETKPVNENMPTIAINVPGSFDLGEGWTFVNYYGNTGSNVPNYPFIFDSFGDIRWYLDLRQHPQLSKLFYGDGMKRLKNGNFFFGFWKLNNIETYYADRIYEMNMFGEIIHSWDMPGYHFHHEAIEKPNGNFLATVDKDGEPTVQDYIIEIDRNTSQVIRVWNLNESLDNTRKAMTDNEVDWFHNNAVFYDESDNTILASGRTQGLVKLTEDNEVVWIMGPHRGWGVNGNGVDLSQFLLQPLDASGQPIEDEDVLDGAKNHPDFEWNWYQHATKIMPNGDISMFDNGDNRNFVGAGPYSRAVEFKVDEANMTVQQIWAYGKERGAETYAPVISDVDYLSDRNSFLFSPGSTNNGGSYGKIIEIDYDTKSVTFEATITPPRDLFGTFHRVERMSLYPEKQ